MTKGASGSARPPRVASTSARRPRPALPVGSVIQGTFRAPASSSALLRRVVIAHRENDGQNGRAGAGAGAPKARAATDAPRATSTYTLEGIADRISCPTLVLEAENDHVFAGEAGRVAAALRCLRPRGKGGKLRGGAARLSAWRAPLGAHRAP